MHRSTFGIEPARHGCDELTELADPAKNLVPALGIVGIEVTPRVAGMIGSLRIDSGVIVAAKAAEPSGFETPLDTGDVIHGVNARPVATLDDLRAALKNLGPDTPLVLQVERDACSTYRRSSAGREVTGLQPAPRVRCGCLPGP